MDVQMAFGTPKSARRCGAKHIFKSKVLKTVGFEPLFHDSMAIATTTTATAATTTTTTTIKGPDNPTCVALCVRKTRVEEKEGEKRRRRFVACRLHKVKGDKRRV